MLRPLSTSAPLVRVRGDSGVIAKLNEWGPYASKNEAIEAARKTILEVVPTATDPQVDIWAAIGLFESNYGLTPSWRLPPPSGEPSYNWGGLRAGPGDEKLVHGDHDAQGKPGEFYFAVFPTMAAGFRRFLSTLGNEAAMASASGDATRVAAIMYRNHYYSHVEGTNEERILAYAKMIEAQARLVAANAGRGTKVFLGPVPADWRAGAKPGSVYPGDAKGLSGSVIAGGAGLLVGLAAGAGAVWYFFLRGKAGV